MATITVSLPTDGDTIDVADYNTPITTIVNDYNGGITNANISAAAGIAGSKLADASIPLTKITNPYKARAFANTNQTVNDNTAAAVTFGTESYDTNNNFATNAYTVPVTGYYQLNVQVTLTAIGKIAVADMYVYSDATVIGTMSNAQGTALDSIVPLGYADSVYLTAGKVITVKALCNTSDGSTAVVNGSAAGSQTFISIHLLSV